MKNKKQLLALLVLCGTAASGMVATAGTKTDKPVYVLIQPDGSGEAAGSPGSTRASSDPNARINCKSWVYSDGPITMICSARDANGVEGWCYTYEPNLQQLLSAQSDTALRFSWDTGARCTYVETDAGSEWAPKQP